MLPRTISPDLIRALQRLVPGDPCFIGELGRELVVSEKTRFREACQSLGDDCRKWWAQQAMRWAPLINHDNVWHAEDFRFIYRASVNVGWAKEVMISDNNYRFVQTARGLFSLPEFEWLFGQPLLGHLQDMRDRQDAELAAVRRHLESLLVSVTVVLADAKGVEETRQLRVLSCQTADDWHIPPGLRLVAIN